MEEKNKYYFKIISKIAVMVVGILLIYLSLKVTIFYMPFVIALIVASIAEPIIKLLMKKTKLKRKSASIISLIIILSVIILIITILATSLINESIKLINNVGIYTKDLYNIGVEKIEELQSGKIQIPNEIMQIFQNGLAGFVDWMQNFIVNFFTGLINTLGYIPTWITYGFITIMAIVLICIDRDFVIDTIKKHVPSQWILKAKEIINITCSVGWKYIKAESKLSFICFVLVLISLLFMKIIGFDMEYPIILAIIIGFIDLLPLFGAGAVMIPYAIYSLITGNIPVSIGIIVTWIIWAILKNILEPKFVSKQMGIHPIFTLLVMYTGFALYGVLGLILGPIVLLILKNLFSELIEKGILKTFFEKE